MKLYYCALLYLFSYYIYSQEKERDQGNIALEQIIRDVEEKFDISFSYLNSLVADKYIGYNITQDQELEEVLLKLQEESGLYFTQINANTVVIRQFKSGDLISVCGFLSQDGKALTRNVQVLVNGAQWQLELDKDGYFKLNNVPYGVPITFATPGLYPAVYNSKKLLSPTCLEVILTSEKLSTEVLDTVILENYLGTGIEKTSNGLLIKLPKIKTFPGLVEPDILQSLQLTPGVNNPYEKPTGLHIRGSTPDQNLILWNGIKTYNQGHLFGMLSAFNPYVVDKVQLIKKGAHPRYGDRLAGIVNIETGSSVPDHIQGSAGINLLNADANLKVPLVNNKLSIGISGRRSYTEELQTPTYSQIANRVFQNTAIINDNIRTQKDMDQMYFQDHSGNVTFIPNEHHTFVVNALYNKNFLEFTSRETENIQNQYADQLKIENEGYSFNYAFNTTENFSLDLEGFYSKYISDYGFITQTDQIPDQRENKKNSIQNMGGTIEGTLQIANDFEATLGYQYDQTAIRYLFETVTPSFTLTLDQDQNTLVTHSVFGNLAYNKRKKWHVDIGIRANYYNSLKQTTFEPRLLVKQYLSPSFFITASGELRSQAVNRIQESIISNPSFENNIWTISDSLAVPLATSYQVSLGATYRKRSWFLDVDTYYKEIDGLTTRTVGFIDPIDPNQKDGISEIYGLDLFLKKEFGAYNSWVSYAYINAQNTFAGLNNDQPFRSNTNIEHTIRWSHFYELKNFTFSLGWLWHTGKYFTEVKSGPTDESFNTVSFSEINGQNLPVYNRVDASVLYDFSFSKKRTTSYRLGVSVINLLNQNNLINKEFRITNSLNSQFIQTESTSLGITPNVSLRILW